MGFWIVAASIATLVSMAILAVFIRPRRTRAPAAAYDLQVYRDQLSEIDRDLERGVIGEDEAARSRTEISRRVLEADRALQAAEAQGATLGQFGPVVMGGALLAVVLGALGLYSQIGAPGYPDLPLETRLTLVEEARAARPNQTEAEAGMGPPPEIARDPQLVEMVSQLRTIMERRPDDLDGMRLLADNEANLGNYRAARLAQGRLVELLGAQATGREYSALAELMVLAAGGYVSPEAEEALVETLTRAPQDGSARYYTGLMYAQQGRPDLAYPVWRALLAESAPNAPWLGPIRLQIEDVAYLAGDPIRLADLPQPRDPGVAETLPGPSQDQLEAAQDMSEEDRLEMVRGMVSGLADRLASEGGTAAEWARLIGAFIVLDQRIAAQGAYEEASRVYAEDAAAVEMLDRAIAPLRDAAP